MRKVSVDVVPVPSPERPLLMTMEPPVTEWVVEPSLKVPPDRKGAALDILGRHFECE